MDRTQRHNRPKKKEKPQKVWDNEFTKLRETYGGYYKEK
jgi:hypothetical protein